MDSNTLDALLARSTLPRLLSTYKQLYARLVKINPETFYPEPTSFTDQESDLDELKDHIVLINKTIRDEIDKPGNVEQSQIDHQEPQPQRNQIREDRPKHGDIIKLSDIPIFENEKLSIYDWIIKLENISGLNNWDGETKRKVLWAKLGPKILQILQAIPGINISDTSYEDLKFYL
jgi:hypothetical protein